jgi:hypothetical protein
MIYYKYHRNKDSVHCVSLNGSAAYADQQMLSYTHYKYTGILQHVNAGDSLGYVSH